MANYKPMENTVLNYLNYVYLRLQNGHKVDEDEQFNIYDYYIDYCSQNKLEKFEPMMFYRELARLGIRSSQRYNAKLKGRKRYRELSYNKLKDALEKWNNDHVITSSKIQIDGIYYQVITKLIKI